MKQDAYSTHQFSLMASVLATNGPVVEFGGGYYSTPLLNAVARIQARKVYTVENSPRVFEELKAKYEFRNHIFRFLPYWEWVFDETNFSPNDMIDYDWLHLQQCQNVHKEGGSPRWGVVFIDQGPVGVRRIALDFFSDKADYVVIHDSEPEHDNVYGYSAVFPKFKYRKSFSSFTGPDTTVLSKFIDIDF